MITNRLFSTLLVLLATGHCFAKANSDTTLIRTHLTAITKTAQFRTYKNIDQLNKTADYIKTIFNQGIITKNAFQLSWNAFTVIS